VELLLLSQSPQFGKLKFSPESKTVQKYILQVKYTLLKIKLYISMLHYVVNYLPGAGKSFLGGILHSLDSIPSGKMKFASSTNQANACIF